jgi:hypothetical protein
MSNKAMQASVYVGLIKMADLMHDLADQVHRNNEEDSKPIEEVHRDIEKGLEGNLRYFADFAQKDRKIPMKVLETLNQRILEVRAKLRD